MSVILVYDMDSLVIVQENFGSLCSLGCQKESNHPSGLGTPSAALEEPNNISRAWQ